MQGENFFPDIITNLPRADIPVQDLSAYLLQCANHQVAIMSFENDAEFSEHTHEAQWGVVLDGELELMVKGEKRIYKRGDTYFIPGNVPHSSKIKAGYKDLTLFNQKDRYRMRIEP